MSNLKVFFMFFEELKVVQLFFSFVCKLVLANVCFGIYHMFVWKRFTKIFSASMFLLTQKINIVAHTKVSSALASNTY